MSFDDEFGGFLDRETMLAGDGAPGHCQIYASPSGRYRIRASPSS